MVVLYSPSIFAEEPATKFRGVYSPPFGETKVQVRDSYALAQATKMAVPPDFLLSLVGFLVMVSQIGFCSSGFGLALGTGVGVASGYARAAGLGTGKTSVGALILAKTA